MLDGALRPKIRRLRPQRRRPRRRATFAARSPISRPSSSTRPSRSTRVRTSTPSASSCTNCSPASRRTPPMRHPRPSPRSARDGLACPSSCGRVFRNRCRRLRSRRWNATLARRYQSAREMQLDLQRYVDGRPVTARPSQYDATLATRVRAHVDQVERMAAAPARLSARSLDAPLGLPASRSA